MDVAVVVCVAVKRSFKFGINLIGANVNICFWHYTVYRMTKH